MGNDSIWEYVPKKKWGQGFSATEEKTPKPPNQAVTPSVSTDNVFAPYYESMRKEREKQYNADLATLETSRSLQRQEAAINNELMKKYMPQLNQMNGLTGLGVSESANLESLSRYQNTLSGIEQSYSQRKSELDRYLRTDLADLNAAERAEQREDQRDAYGVALEHIASGAITDSDSLERYLTAVTPTVTDGQLNQLKALGESLIGESKGKTGSTTATGTVNAGGDSVTIQVGSRGVPLSIVGQTYLQDAIDVGGDYNDGDVFLYDKKIYYKQNDAVYELMDASGNNNSKNYSAAYNFLKSGTVPEGYGAVQSPDTPQSERIDRFDAPEGARVVDTNIYPEAPHNVVTYDGSPRDGISNVVVYNGNGVPANAKLMRTSVGEKLKTLMRRADADTPIEYDGNHYVKIGAVVYKITYT